MHLLCQRHTVTLQTGFSFSKVIDLLAKKGYQPFYKTRLHPIVSRLGLEPRIFASREILTNRAFPGTLFLIKQQREEHQRERTSSSTARSPRKQPVSLSLLVATAGPDTSSVQKAHEATLGSLGISTATIHNWEHHAKLAFEKRHPKVSPTGTSLTEPSVAQAVQALKGESTRRLAMEVKRSRLVSPGKLPATHELGSPSLSDDLEELSSRGVCERITIAFCCGRLVSIIGPESKAAAFLKLGTSCPSCHKSLQRDKLLKAYRLTSAAEKA